MMNVILVWMSVLMRGIGEYCYPSLDVSGEVLVGTIVERGSSVVECRTRN